MAKNPTSASTYGKIPGDAIFAARRKRSVAMKMMRPPTNPDTRLQSVESPTETMSIFGGPRRSSEVSSSSWWALSPIAGFATLFSNSGFAFMEEMESHEKSGGYGDNDIGYVEIRKIFQVDEIRDFSHPDTVDAVSDGSGEKRGVRRVDDGRSTMLFLFEIVVRNVGDEDERENLERHSRNRGRKRDAGIALVPERKDVSKHFHRFAYEGRFGVPFGGEVSKKPRRERGNENDGALMLHARMGLIDGFPDYRFLMILSMRPYSRASSGDMKLSRSQSISTCFTGLPVCLARMS